MNPTGQDRSSGRPIQAVIDVPQSVIDEFNRQDHDQAQREEKKLCWDRIGVLAVIFYGFVAFITWMALLRSNSINKASADAAKESADAMVAASRAWMLPAGSEATGSSIVLRWTNGGKSPAVHVRATAEYKLREGASYSATSSTPIFSKTFKGGCDHLRSSDWISGSPSMVTAGDSFEINPLQHIPLGWYQAPSKVPPQLPSLGPKTVNLGIVRILFIHGCVWYTDVLTNQERTTEFYYQATRLMGPKGFPQVVILPGRPELQGPIQGVTLPKDVLLSEPDPFVFR
jgi:hypothetical protein